MATQLDALFVEIFFKGDQRALDNFKRGWKQLDDGIKNTQQTLDRFAKRFAVAGAIGSAAMAKVLQERHPEQAEKLHRVYAEGMQVALGEHAMLEGLESAKIRDNS